MAEVKSLDVLLLKSIFSKIDYPCNVEFIDSLWTMDECQITWNEDDSEKDLLDGALEIHSTMNTTLGGLSLTDILL